MDIRLSVITINYNGLRDTCDLLSSIPYDSTTEIIVVDNASFNDEATVIEQQFPHVKVVRSPENVGFAGGNNLGIEASSGRYLLFINNDTVFRHLKPEDAKPFLQPLIDRLESDQSIGLVCPKLRFAWGECPIQFTGYTPLSAITMRNHSIGYGESDYGQYDQPHPTPYAHGAAMLAKREAVMKAGLMPECYFLYYEELDWSMLFRRAGYTIWYEPRCTVFHKESQATGQNSPLKTYYITRNRLIFTRRNTPMPTRLLTYAYLIGPVLLRDCLKYTLKGKSELRRAALRGVADFFKRREGNIKTSKISHKHQS